MAETKENPEVSALKNGKLKLQSRWVGGRTVALELKGTGQKIYPHRPATVEQWIVDSSNMSNHSELQYFLTSNEAVKGFFNLTHRTICTFM